MAASAWLADDLISVTVESPPFVVIGIELAILRVTRRKYFEHYAAASLLAAIQELDRNSAHWKMSRLRWHVAAHLEGAAKAVERIPLGLKGVGAGVRLEALRVSKARAHAMRQLEIRAVQPDEFSCLDMTERLTNDFRTIVEGRWYALPEAQYEYHSPRWLLSIRIIVPLIALAGAIVSIGFISGSSQLASVLGVLSGAIITWLFDKGSLPLGSIERGA